MTVLSLCSQSSRLSPRNIPWRHLSDCGGKPRHYCGTRSFRPAFRLIASGQNGATLAGALSIAVTGGITSSLTYGVMGWTQPITPDFERNALRAAHVPPLVWP